ncbi:MAG: thioredoxin domain-containing protein [Bryobacteraceae bacterium]|nr:thioredoxin domain-containing protein [Bryobacteraceae bacterium]
MPSNRLALEKSPYLLQHAHNPVDWYAWGPEAFDKAKHENKPIFLSIGYSTCHWCHVMERESFESDAVAEVLNRFFVPIKVDREERPDVDRIYMSFVQATTGSGGWPMSVWLTPELKPFFGGTYFPPDSRYGRPGFRQVLEQLATAWQTDREQILKSGDDVLEQLRKHVEGDGAQHAPADQAVFDSCFYQFRRAFDSRLGGFGGSPKFPRPSTLNFLLRYSYLTKNAEASDMVVLTLREMAKGGMNDQLGGGFHRYSVDARWFVPHFEKMLYDQAQLAIAYLEAFQVTGDAALAQVARDIFEYVLRDMTNGDGAFYSAEDADSVIHPDKPHEKGEGAFYVWDAEEIAHLAGDAAEWFGYRYGVEPGGNVMEDPHSEFTGKNILYERFTIADTARRFAVTEEEVTRALDEAKHKLLAARASRIRPHLDDKVLTAWNGLMISAFALGGRVLHEPRYTEAAHQAAGFVLKNLCTDNLLLRRWRDGDAAVGGFLDDYAFFVQGLLDLYETDFEDNHLRSAIELTSRMVELFEDPAAGGFFSAADGDTSLVLRAKEDYDGAEPSGNSVAILNLLRLAHITGRAEWREKAEHALRAFGGKMAAGPTGLPQMLVAAMFAVTPPKQIVLAGARDSMGPMRAAICSRYLPFHTLVWAGSHALNPELKNMGEVHGRPTAYVCENFTCQLPVSETEKLTALLQ